MGDKLPNSQQLGRYELLGELGSGGMARVYRARVAGPRGFEKSLVLKCMLPQLVEEQQFVDMFLTEAKLAAQLNHPNIVHIFDFGEADGQYYLAMEYIDGPNLRMLIRRARQLGTPLPVAHCAKIISFACEGLAHAHEFLDPATGEPLRLIHRDISPDNILLARTGAVKVVDFGIAKATTQVHQTQVGALKGKVSCMAPEQIRGEELDLRIDVYALGVVLHELLTGRKPFEGNSDVSLMHAILHESLPDLTSRRPDLPEALQRIIHKALAKDREQRYLSCRDLHADLERFLASLDEQVGAFHLAQLVSQLGQGSRSGSSPGTPTAGSNSLRRLLVPPTPPPLVMEPSTMQVVDPPVSEPPPPPPPAPAKRPAWLLAAVGLGALLLLGGVGVVFFARSQPEASPPVATTAPVAVAPPPAVTPPPAVAPPAPVSETPAESSPTAESLAMVEKASPVEPAAMEQIELELRVVPSHAQLMLDGRMLPANPFLGLFPRDGVEHELRISASGFAPMAKKIRFEKDMLLEFNLKQRSRDVRRVRSTRRSQEASKPSAESIDEATSSEEPFADLPARPAASSTSKRQLDGDSPWSQEKRKLDTDSPWTDSKRSLDSADPWKE